jgi:hypothetical protein
MFTFYRNWLLLSPDKDQDGGNGGRDKDSDTGGSGNSLTKDEISNLIDQKMQGATKNIIGRLSKKLEEKIDTVFSDEDSPLNKRLKELESKKGTSNDPKDQDKEPGSEDIKAMNARLEKLENENKTLKSEREKAKKNSLQEKQFDHVMDIVSKNGFKTRSKFVAQELIKKISFEGADPDTGEIGKPKIGGKDDIEISLDEYLKNEYSKSDEGKSMLDTESRSGSGSGTGGDETPLIMNESFLSVEKIDSMTDEEILKTLPTLQ